MKDAGAWCYKAEKSCAKAQSRRAGRPAKGGPGREGREPSSFLAGQRGDPSVSLLVKGGEGISPLGRPGLALGQGQENLAPPAPAEGGRAAVRHSAAHIRAQCPPCPLLLPRSSPRVEDSVCGWCTRACVLSSSHQRPYLAPTPTPGRRPPGAAQTRASVCAQKTRHTLTGSGPSLSSPAVSCNARTMKNLLFTRKPSPYISEVYI